MKSLYCTTLRDVHTQTYLLYQHIKWNRYRVKGPPREQIAPYNSFPSTKSICLSSHVLDPHCNLKKTVKNSIGSLWSAEKEIKSFFFKLMFLLVSCDTGVMQWK